MTGVRRLRTVMMESAVMFVGLCATWAAMAGDAQAARSTRAPSARPAAASATEPSGMTQSEAFFALRKAMQDVDLSRFETIAAVIPAQHPLREYVSYWRFRIRLHERYPEPDPTGLDREVAAFIAAHPDRVSADLLRRDWMLSLGRRDEWTRFDEVYPTWVLKDDNGPLCLEQLSRRRRNVLEVDAARQLIMRPTDLHKTCARLFTTLADEHVLDTKDIQRRLRFAVEANQGSDIRDAAIRLPALANDDDAEATIDRSLRQPATVLASDESRGELLVIAVSRLARSAPDQAAQWLATTPRARSALDAAAWQFAWAQVAAAGARQLEPASLDWARQGLDAHVSDETRVWLARSALREWDLPTLLTIVDRMTASTRGETAWTYWRARALQATGKPDEARTLLRALSEQTDLYGKLAAEELGMPIRPPAAPPRPAQAAISAFDANPAFARAQAFYEVGMRFEGNREWNFALRGMDDSTLRAAARWAQGRGLLDRAISTDERIRSSADQELRFPTPFVRDLAPVAKLAGLDVAWVYGLIRQESRFIQDARSSVGASGLMQMMPATARWVARKLGRKHFETAQLNDLKTNLEFGTYYLKSVLDDLDGSAVLATAGYNAGPRRAHAWRTRVPRSLEGAAFAEIIPFAETRGYVKAVISNAVDYAALMTGESQSVKARLGFVQREDDSIQSEGRTDLP